MCPPAGGSKKFNISYTQFLNAPLYQKKKRLSALGCQKSCRLNTKLCILKKFYIIDYLQCNHINAVKGQQCRVTHHNYAHICKMIHISVYVCNLDMYVLYLSEREIREVKSNIGRSIYYTQRYAYQDRVDVGQLITQCQFFFILYRHRFVQDVHIMIPRKQLAIK